MASIEFIRSIQDDFESVFGMAVDTTDNKVKVMSRYGDLDNSDGAIQNFTTINMYWTSVYAGKNAPASSDAGLTYFWAPEPVFDHNSSPYKRGRMDRYLWAGEFRKNSSGKTVFAGSNNIGGQQTDGYMMVPRSYFDPTKRVTQPGLQALPFDQDGIRIKIKSNLSGGLPPNTFVPLCGYVLSRRTADRYLNQGAEMENAFGKGYQYFWSEPNNERYSVAGVGTTTGWEDRGFPTSFSGHTAYAPKQGTADALTFANTGSAVLERGFYEFNNSPYRYYQTTGNGRNEHWKVGYTFSGFYQKGNDFNKYEYLSEDMKAYMRYVAANVPYQGNNEDTTWTDSYAVWAVDQFRASEFISAYGGAYAGIGGRTAIEGVTIWNSDTRKYANSSPVSSENPVMGHIPSTVQDREPSLNNEGLYSRTNYAKNSLIYGYPLIGPDLLKPFFGKDNPSVENEKEFFGGRSLEEHWQKYPGLGGQWQDDDRYRYEKWHGEGWLSNGIENNTIWIMYSHDGAGNAMIVACPGEIMDRDGSETAQSLNALNPYNSQYTTHGNPGYFLWQEPKFYTNWFTESGTLSSLWDAAGFNGVISQKTGRYNSDIYHSGLHRLITMHWCNLADRTLDELTSFGSGFSLSNNSLYNSRSTYDKYYTPNYARSWHDSGGIPTFSTMKGTTFTFTEQSGYDNPENFSHSDYIYSHAFHLAGSVMSNPIYNRSTLMAYGPVSNASLTQETEFLLNVNTQYIVSENLNQAWGLSDIGLYNGQAGETSDMFTDGRIAAGPDYLTYYDDLNGASTQYNWKAYAAMDYTQPVQGQFMTNYLSGSINGLKFYNVPGQSCFTSNVGSLSGGRSYDTSNVWQTRFAPYEERGCFWPALILRPSIEHDIEISEFSFAYFNHDYQMNLTGGNVEGLDRVYKVNSSMPYKFGDYGYSYDPFKNIKLPSDNEGYVPIDSVDGWNNVENLIDKDVNTKARITKSGPDNAIYLPLSSHLNDDTITNASQLKIKRLTLNIKGVSIFGLNAHVIKAQVVKSDKVTMVMQTSTNSEADNAEVSAVPLNSVGSWPADDAGFMIVFGDSTANATYSDVRDGFLKIWVDPV